MGWVTSGKPNLIVGITEAAESVYIFWGFQPVKLRPMPGSSAGVPSRPLPGTSHLTQGATSMGCHRIYLGHPEAANPSINTVLFLEGFPFL